MKRIVVAGAGRIGGAIATLLAGSGDYTVTVIDRDAEALGRVARHSGVATRCLAVSDPEALGAVLTGCFAVVCATPYDLTTAVATAARAAGVHYLDLTEDVAATRVVTELAADADRAFIPQCGLAPGFVSIAGMALARRFDELDSLRLRVGALPQFPSNALGYNLTWSSAGVVNEYCQPCEAIAGGQRVQVPALEELEHFAIDGVQYEAFNTSGGLGTLCETLQGAVRTLNYRSVRYPGHRDAMKLLLHDLRLAERPAVLADLLEQSIPATTQDVVVIFVTATGRRHGRLSQESYARRILPVTREGREWTAIQITTASSACAVLDLLASGRLPARGLIRQEQIDLEAFLANRFGRVFAAGETTALERSSWREAS